MSAAQNPLAPKVSRKPKNTSQQIVESFSLLAASAGCPIEQTLNFIRAGMWLQPKQLEMAAAARLCDHRCPSCQAKVDAGERPVKDCPECGPRAIGVGGARGGGKSQWMVAQVAIDDCQRYPGLNFLYVRKSAKTLRAQMTKLLRKTIPPNIKYNYREQLGEVVFENGSVITIRHFKDESEIDNFLGEEYDGIAYEELTTLSEDKFTNLNTCLRTSKKGWRPRIYASWNWGGAGHAWTKKFFYDPWKHRRQTVTRYILALVQDNKHIDPEYESGLQNLVGWKYQSWYLGNPDLAAGNFFSHYREDVHVYPCDCPGCKSEQTYVLRKGVIKCGRCDLESNAITFEDVDAVRWWGSMDYGSSHPNCFHLHAENADGECFTVGELHTIDDGISECAEGFRDLLRQHNLEIGELEAVFSGHDVSKTDRKTKDDGSTIATEYQENGIMLTPIYINRVNAFSQMQERLGDPQRGKKPTWYIQRTCSNLRLQIMNAQYDPKKPNDIIKQNSDKETGEGGDDALECITSDSLIYTKVGLKQIKNVAAGEFVMTRDGFKKVIASGLTRRNAKIKFIFLANGASLRATPNHLVWVAGEGWKRIDEIRDGCDILVCENYCRQPMSESSMGSISTDTPNRKTTDHADTSGHQPTIIERVFKCFIRKFGSRLMAPFQRGGIFIMRTMTHSTMTLAISPASQTPSTTGFILKSATPFTPNGETKSSALKDNQSASHAVRSLQNALNADAKHQRGIIIVPRGTSVLSPVLQNGIGIADSTMRSGNAGTVIIHFRHTNHQSPSFVPCRVQTISDGAREDVYNLTVADCPEYFANGILVHNCARNGIVGAYNSLLDCATPVKMGNYQSATEAAEQPDSTDIEAQIVEAVNLDFERNRD